MRPSQQLDGAPLTDAEMAEHVQQNAHAGLDLTRGCTAPCAARADSVHGAQIPDPEHTALAAK